MTVDAVRDRRLCRRMLPAEDPWHPILLSMLVATWDRLDRLESRLAEEREHAPR